MQEEVLMGSIQESVSAMTLEAAKHYMEVGQAYAELYPKPATLELVKPVVDKQMEMMRMLGEMAPSGMCLVHWQSRGIMWSNNAYKKVFLDNISKETTVGMRIDDLIPGFEAAGLEAIFESVARTKTPFSTSSYELMLPSGPTYWDWSLVPLTCADSGDVSLLIQMKQAYPARQSLAA